MSHLVRKEGWAVIDLDTASRTILVREDWRYEWAVARGQAAWREDEKTAFHRAVDRAVWAHWSRRVRIQARDVRATGRFKPRDLRGQIAGSVFSLSFDVRRVHSGGQWRVSVKKVDPLVEGKPQALVDFEAKTVQLFTTDLLVTKAKRAANEPWRFGFNVPAHEFGHTIGNAGPYGDEYKRGVVGYDDVESIMNVGRELRARHLRLLCETLRAMVPGCEFIPLL